MEHHYGTIVGRDAIRSTITALMAPVPMMQFPVEWYVISGNRVVYYPWQVFPDPAGGDAEYRFGCITVLEYAGDGQFSRQEDVYNPINFAAMVAMFLFALSRSSSSAGVVTSSRARPIWSLYEPL